MKSLVLKTGTTKKTAGAYQEPEVPDVEREAAQHLDHGCQQDHILEMPEGRKAKHERSIPALLNTPAPLPTQPIRSTSREPPGPTQGLSLQLRFATQKTRRVRTVNRKNKSELKSQAPSEKDTEKAEECRRMEISSKTTTQAACASTR